MHHLSLSALSVLPCSPVEQVRAAAVAGYDFVSLRLVPVMESDVDVMASPVLQQELRHAVRNAPLEVFDVEVVRITPGLDVQALRPMLQFAADLGAQRVAVTSGTEDECGGAAMAATLARLDELAAVCAELGLGVMLEFIPYRPIANFGQAREIVTTLGRPNVGITVDALHFFRSGSSLDDLANTRHDVLACAQLCDAPSSAPASLPHEARYGRLTPGAGGFPLIDFVKALPQELTVCAEVPAPNRGGLNIVDRARILADSSRDLLDGTAG